MRESKLSLHEYEPSLPAEVRTRSGVIFNPNEICWSWRDSLINVSLDFTPFEKLISKQLLFALKTTLAWYATFHSPGSIIAARSRVLHFLRTILTDGRSPLNSIEKIHIANYKSQLPEETAYYLGQLASILRRWKLLGLPGVDGAVAVLEDMRIGGGRKGQAVMTRCPLAGPFTTIELENIQFAIDLAFSENRLDESVVFFAWLLLALGQRPYQYAALKVCDLVRTTNKDGIESFQLKVPRAKQKENPRTSFSIRALIPQIGRPLWEYAERTRSRFNSLIPDPNQAPLFPQKERAKMPPGFEYHYTAPTLGQTFKLAVEGLQIISERTGEPMVINSRRFRRTFATRLAQEGCSELIIAELLDHSDTQNVQIYVQAVPEIAARIDRSIAMNMAPLAQAFKGTLIEDESKATRSLDPSSRIRDLRIDRSGDPLGSCGKYSFCGQWAPISCYTCTSFEPWLDAPHEAVFIYLLNQRDNSTQKNSMRYSSINDRTILAVAEVIQLCNDILRERDSGDE